MLLKSISAFKVTKRLVVCLTLLLSSQGMPSFMTTILKNFYYQLMTRIVCQENYGTFAHLSNLPTY